MKRLSILFLLAAFAIAAWLAWSFRGYTPDDTFIYLRYADNWAAGRGLVFNPGERVQGYTSPLWTLLIAIASSAGVSSLAFAKMAGAIFGAGCIALSHLIAKRFDARAGALAPIVLVGFMDLPYWAVSGMDTAMFAFMTALAVLLTLRARDGGPASVAAIAWGLTGVTRPEGMALGLIAVAWLLWDSALPSRRRVAVWSMFALPIAAWLLFAWSYHGNPLPNTYWAKRFDHLESARRGLAFLRAFLAANDGAFIAAGLAAALWHPARRALMLLAALGCAYSCYLLWSGGDSWAAPHAFRFTVPMLVPISVAMAAGCSEAWRRFTPGAPRLFAGAAAAAVLALWLVFPAAPGLRIHAVGGDPAIVDHLRASSDAGDVLAVTDIGQFAWRTDLPVIDMFGLVDPYVASLRKRIGGTYAAGEDQKLVAYVMQRRPRWIILKGTAGPGGLTVRDETAAPAMYADARFRERYRFVMAGRAEPYLLFERVTAD